MKSVATQDRPREKLDRCGVQALGDNELLAVIISHGTAQAGALDIANGLLSGAGSLRHVQRMTREELASVPGVGRALAGRLQAAFEIGRRTLAIASEPSMRFVTSLDCGRFLLPLYGAHPVERFGLMMLDARQRLIRADVVAVGSADFVLVHPRDVFRAAILARATSIVAFHNHPTGDVTPSRADVELTQRLLSAGRLVGIDVMDHLILGETRYCSVREARLFEWRG